MDWSSRIFITWTGCQRRSRGTGPWTGEAGLLFSQPGGSLQTELDPEKDIKNVKNANIEISWFLLVGVNFYGSPDWQWSAEGGVAGKK